MDTTPYLSGSDTTMMVRRGAPKLLLDVRETCQALGVGRSYLYENLFATGKVTPVRIGRSVRVPVRELERYIASLVDEQQP